MVLDMYKVYFIYGLRVCIKHTLTMVLDLYKAYFIYGLRHV